MIEISSVAKDIIYDNINNIFMEKLIDLFCVSVFTMQVYCISPTIILHSTKAIVTIRNTNWVTFYAIIMDIITKKK